MADRRPQRSGHLPTVGLTPRWHDAGTEQCLQPRVKHGNRRKGHCGYSVAVCTSLSVAASRSHSSAFGCDRGRRSRPSRDFCIVGLVGRSVLGRASMKPRPVVGSPLGSAACAWRWHSYEERTSGSISSPLASSQAGSAVTARCTSRVRMPRSADPPASPCRCPDDRRRDGSGSPHRPVALRPSSSSSLSLSATTRTVRSGR